jgi:hypothetical protein
MLKRPVLVLIIALGVSCLMINISLRSARAQSKYKKPATTPTPTPTPYTLPYQPGDVKGTVRGGENPVIRIALAGSGVTVVEFPSTDRFFAVHPPGSQESPPPNAPPGWNPWVVVENSPTLKTDHHLVLRAGRDLMNASGAAASLSVQMRSGLVVTIWLYPVKMVWAQTHRFVLSYDREEIVEARRRAGLAVNLGENEERERTVTASNNTPLATNDTQTAPPAKTSDNAQPLSPPPVTSAPRAVQNSENPPQVPEASRTKPQSPKSEPVKDSPADKRRKALREMLKDAVFNSKLFKEWTDATNGLSVATNMRDLDDDIRVALIAVKNVESNESLRLMTGHPELVVQTLDKKGKVIQLEQVKKLDEDSTTANNIIPPRATVFYAIAFSPPILGKLQRLRVSVGQRNAADDPAIANLSAKK